MIREDALYVLSRTCDVLESLGKKYWIDSGTVLSAYRDKDINVYDHDIDIRTPVDEWTVEDIGELYKQLWLIGYSYFRDTGDSRIQISAIHKAAIMLDFKFVYFDDTDAWYFCFGEPQQTVLHMFERRFFDTLGTIELYGREYPCPSPVEEYIEAHYGPDWREFKVRAEEADWTDMSWDYMKDPPAVTTEDEFLEKKGRRMWVLINRRE